MVRPLSAEPVKSKRKGTRNVSTLTPVQLARKRAKDREAQRAIRARTKEHIERLERELAGLRSKQSRDWTVQELLRRNKAIEKELIQLKEIMRESMTSSSYCAPGLTPQQLSLPDELLMSTVYDGNPRTDSDAIPSPRGSPFPGDYNSLPDYSQQYIPLSHNCESLASTVSCLIPSNTSSSSIGAVCDKDVIKTEYDDVCHHGTVSQDFPVPDTRYDEEVSHAQYLDARFGLNNPPLHPGTPYSNPYMPHHHQQQQSAWNTYPMYCP